MSQVTISSYDLIDFFNENCKITIDSFSVSDSGVEFSWVKRYNTRAEFEYDLEFDQDYTFECEELDQLQKEYDQLQEELDDKTAQCIVYQDHIKELETIIANQAYQLA